jgi:homoaconitase/3-isopropylmalate dehydratase large subunit
MSDDKNQEEKAGKKSRRRRMPTKAELVQLQKLYRTDEKIGERLGGVPAYLVAYWRRKKGVPKHSQPKFSEKEIRDLWERFGDDDRCGLELGISKAAFYNWRRRYGIREKPAFLKLEQLELNFPGMKTPPHAASLRNKQTIVQKIMARAGGKGKVEVDQEVTVEPDLVILRRNVGKLLGHLLTTADEYVFNSSKILLNYPSWVTADHETPTELHRRLREFAGRQRLKNIFDFTDGALHQAAIENGHVLPGGLILGSDERTCALGCMAGMGAAIDQDRMATLLTSGSAAIKVPESVRIDVSGRRARGVYAKDIALSIIKRLAEGDVTGRSIEFYGSAISQMSISERFTLCGLAGVAGAYSATCQFDSTTRRYLMQRAPDNLEPVVTDKNAVYENLFQVNVEQLQPQVAGPNGLDTIRPVGEVENLPVQLIIIGTAANGRFDDLRVAAEILKGQQISPECRVFVLPASRSVYLEALKKGLIRMLSEAGAQILPPGHCARDGYPIIQLGDGQRALSTANHAASGCLGSEKGEVYLCSPATAAASALHAAVTDSTRYGR